MLDEVTDDSVLGGRILLRQPTEGYRTALDPVLLAAAVEERHGRRILDLGCGVGTVALCLAARLRNTEVHGLEIQPELVRLAHDNVSMNALLGRVIVHEGALGNLPMDLAPGRFDQVVVNPPYLDPVRNTVSADPGKALADTEQTASLSVWVDTALMCVRRKGVVLFVHRADRVQDLLCALQGKAGEIVLFPLWPKRNHAAKRVIVRARKDVQTPLHLASGLALHEEDGRFTPAAEAILRDGAAMLISA